MLANWMLLPYVLAAVWWSYSPLDDLLFLTAMLTSAP